MILDTSAIVAVILGQAESSALARALLAGAALLAAGHVVMRGISQTSGMVRWCVRTSAYRVVGAPERRLAKTPSRDT